MALPPLLALPRELRDRILDYVALPAYVYTSSTRSDTDRLIKSRREDPTYIDTRIYLPSRPPINVLAICRQLRQESLDHHAHRLNLAMPLTPVVPAYRFISSVLAEKAGTEFLEQAERACDQGTLRITVEVQRKLRGSMGYIMPTRKEMSPRFRVLLPLTERVRKLRLEVWPGYEWWNGGAQPLADKYGNIRTNASQIYRPNPVTFAISKILEALPSIEELSIDALMQASEGTIWDLPDRKWQNIQSWLDTPIAVQGQTLQKITRRLVCFWKPSEPEPFYTQVETRRGSGQVWKVERKGDMCTPTIRKYCDTPEALEIFAPLVVDEHFERRDSESNEPSVVSD